MNRTTASAQQSAASRPPSTTAAAPSHHLQPLSPSKPICGYLLPLIELEPSRPFRLGGLKTTLTVEARPECEYRRTTQDRRPTGAHETTEPCAIVSEEARRVRRVSARSLPASIASSYFEGCEEPVLGQIDAARSARSKHARQRTGRPCLGKNGTIVGLPHSAQMTLVSARPRTFPNLALHFLQCLGSCRNCFSLKN